MEMGMGLIIDLNFSSFIVHSTFIQYKNPEGFHVMKFIYAHPVPGDQKRQWYSISLKQPADRFDLLATLRGHTAFRTYPPDLVFDEVKRTAERRVVSN